MPRRYETYDLIKCRDGHTTAAPERSNRINRSHVNDRPGAPGRSSTEREWDEANVGAQRAALRQEHFARPLARLHRLVTALRARVLPKSGLGQACSYLLGHWAPLTAHLRHSQTRLDTNSVENAIRPSKLGAKNWLFVGHPAAGDRPAVLYSLIVSAQRRGHDPHAYLKDVLTRLPAMTNHSDFTPLLPAHWQPPSQPAPTPQPER